MPEHMSFPTPEHTVASEKRLPKKKEKKHPQKRTTPKTMPFRDITAAYDETVIASLYKKKAPEKMTGQEKFQWNEMHREILSRCVAKINEQLSQKYGIPPLDAEILWQEQLAIASLKQRKADGVYYAGGRLAIEKKYFPEEGKRLWASEVVAFIGVLSHEILHHCSVQIMDARESMHRGGLTFSKRIHRRKYEKAIFGEIDEAVVEKVVSEELKPAEIFRSLFVDHPEYRQFLIQQHEHKPEEKVYYEQSYQLNILVLDHLCDAIATVCRMQGDGRYDTKEKVYEIFKRANFGTGSGGFPLIRLVTKVYGHGAMAQLGELLEKTHPKETSDIQQYDRYKRPVRKLLKFIEQDKEGLIEAADQQAIGRLYEINQRFVTDILSAGKVPDDHEELIEELDRLLILRHKHSPEFWLKKELRSFWLRYCFDAKNGAAISFDIYKGGPLTRDQLVAIWDNHKILVTFLQQFSEQFGQRSKRSAITIDELTLVCGPDFQTLQDYRFARATQAGRKRIKQEIEHLDRFLSEKKDMMDPLELRSYLSRINEYKKAYSDCNYAGVIRKYTSEKKGCPTILLSLLEYNIGHPSHYFRVSLQMVKPKENERS